MISFAIFIGCLVFYHLSEFSLTAYYNREELCFDSLLLSKDYLIAMSVAITEYMIELYFFPWLKEYHTLSMIGFILVIIGEGLRKVSMIQAKQSFTHNIQHHKRKEHTLVTSGLYHYIRHPGYLGWFIWSISTQILLMNPISFVAFAVVSWMFFADRIPYEERLLLRFFGDEYEEYRKRTPTWIPFIR
eukprot:TRINITY_DN12998_c0_g1::TRINITY_DN12998_c0_g1_i1::g.11045::m.11045 TRINITY_DN12998_c0_g1::TRINITY_DN12998_c0_g1_i1::g.11045  ORF type:complete len:188 (-),score=3.95,sp/Q7XSR9/ICMT_ORYSJ/47.80/1e-55,ICMT/PF04140.9/8.6e-29,PEMT/PF04191.8/1.5e-13,DUF1295/PF06966.7/2.2e-07,NnrU/PF07298.6/0.0015,ERG4_ERG24/PF01222.12/0.0031 TRINITY_DN12998_c0_g1_i1:97-660(-)